MASYAAAAIAGAVAMQQAVAGHNRRLDGSPLAMRVGLSAGDATFEDGDWFGRPVVEASRLCAAAEGGQILAADLVRVLAGNRIDVELRPQGERQLKGLADPIAVCEVAWVPPDGPAGDGHPPLPDALERAIGSGLGFVGREVEVESLTHGGGAVVLWGGCDEDLGIPYQPFAEPVGQYAHSVAIAELLTGLGALAGELCRLVPDLERLVPGLEPTGRADPEEERHRLFEAVSELRMTAPGPESWRARPWPPLRSWGWAASSESPAPCWPESPSSGVGGGRGQAGPEPVAQFDGVDLAVGPAATGDDKAGGGHAHQAGQPEQLPTHAQDGSGLGRRSDQGPEAAVELMLLVTVLLDHAFGGLDELVNVQPVGQRREGHDHQRGDQHVAVVLGDRQGELAHELVGVLAVRVAGQDQVQDPLLVVGLDRPVVVRHLGR
jgi:hypothetical protein